MRIGIECMLKGIKGGGKGGKESFLLGLQLLNMTGALRKQNQKTTAIFRIEQKRNSR